MPSVKIPRHSTHTDMTPFVDVAFLILSFFIMATKFKPPEPVKITTPGSVSSQKLPQNNAVLITIDTADKVYFTVLSEKDKTKYDDVIRNINTEQNLGLTEAEMSVYKQFYMVGVPFSSLKELLNKDPKQQGAIIQPGIPKDTANNQLYWWINAAKKAFAGEELKYLIKGDSESKYPALFAVIEALKKNEQFKYHMVTSLEGVPSGSELEKYNRAVPARSKE